MNVVNFPENFQCDDIQRELYAALEARMMPVIRRKAQRVRGVVDLDEAVQQGRLTVLKAMASFDINRGHGALDHYVGTCLDNTFSQIFNRANTEGRMPRVPVRDGAQWVRVRKAPVSLRPEIHDTPSDEAGPDADVLTAESEDRVRKFRVRMVTKLKGNDRAVFMAKVCPSPDLLLLVRNLGDDEEEPPSNVAISKHLGISKNAVDYSLAKIRQLATEMADDVEWKDVFTAGRAKGWALVHDASGEGFVRKVLEQRRLDPRPLPRCHLDADFHQAAGIYARRIERYPWGAVVVCQRGDEVRTLVIEGRFKARTGEVFGLNGTRREIPVEWYAELVKALKEGSNP